MSVVSQVTGADKYFNTLTPNTKTRRHQRLSTIPQKDNEVRARGFCFKHVQPQIDLFVSPTSFHSVHSGKTIEYGLKVRICQKANFPFLERKCFFRIVLDF